MRSAAAHPTKCGRTGDVRQHGARLPHTDSRRQQQRFVSRHLSRFLSARGRRWRPGKQCDEECIAMWRLRGLPTFRPALASDPVSSSCPSQLIARVRRVEDSYRQTVARRALPVCASFTVEAKMELLRSNAFTTTLDMKADVVLGTRLAHQPTVLNSDHGGSPLRGAGHRVVRDDDRGDGYRLRGVSLGTPCRAQKQSVRASHRRLGAACNWHEQKCRHDRP